MCPGAVGHVESSLAPGGGPVWAGRSKGANVASSLLRKGRGKTVGEWTKRVSQPRLGDSSWRQAHVPGPAPDASDSVSIDRLPAVPDGTAPGNANATRREPLFRSAHVPSSRFGRGHARHDHRGLWPSLPCVSGSSSLADSRNKDRNPSGVNTLFEQAPEPRQGVSPANPPGRLRTVLIDDAEASPNAWAGFPDWNRDSRLKHARGSAARPLMPGPDVA